ncbi:MAG TPA: hypothetical protein VNE82_19800 [Candidatus Binataceae bacterium]|nr:hypothetical protein [Candidatus Binataceae bacterium]
MTTSGKTYKSAFDLLEATADLPRASMVMEQFANTARLFTNRLLQGGFRASALHVPNDWRFQNAIKVPKVLSIRTAAATPRRAIERTKPSQTLGSTAADITGRTENRPEVNPISSKTLPELATAFSVFHKTVTLSRTSNTAGAHAKAATAPSTEGQTLTEASARLVRSLLAFGQALIAPLTPALIRAIGVLASASDWLTRETRRHPAIAVTGSAMAGTASMLIGLGGAHRFLLRTIRPLFLLGLRDVLWLSRKLGMAEVLVWLVRIAVRIAELAAALVNSSLGCDLVIAAIAGLAVAGYELYRHWDAAERLLSRWTESAHKTFASLMKWTADKTKSAAAYADHSIASLTATLSNAPNSFATVAATTRGMNRARAAAVSRLAPMLRAVGRAAAAAAFAAPLMLAGAPAGAFAPPPISTNDTARLAALPCATNATQGAIVINYAPNVVIHSEDAADSAALKRRVMEILERHGRELHQVLQREMVRQQRRDFQPRLSNGQE